MGCCFSQVAVYGNFLLEVQVLHFINSDSDCGPGDECDLYIDEMCLDPQSGETEQECSLAASTGDLDLYKGLPMTGNLSVSSKPWPVSSSLALENNSLPHFQRCTFACVL